MAELFLDSPSPTPLSSAMSLQSPDGQGNLSGGSGYGSGQSENGKSSFLGLGFLKGLTEKKTRGDGLPTKKRGPKPDAKPALTRRQELNRQAQRTHRERKELYTKALEEEVLRLKENFSAVTRDKENLAEENRQLRTLLAQHGIPWNGNGGVEELMNNLNTSYSSSRSMSGSYATGSQGVKTPPSIQQYNQQDGVGDRSVAQRQVQQGVDYDQAGIDFVLTLERPCMDHMQFLVEASTDADGDACGHAMMASCPTDALFMDIVIPDGHGVNNTVFPQKQRDITKSDLANLLDLSKRLNLEGEITPVMAWGMILEHPRFSELTLQDFHQITEELRNKIRCYGFGAVLEEFELRDALESMFATKVGYR